MNTKKEKEVMLPLVIPAYNEQNNIQLTIREITRIINTMPNVIISQVIIVDDHSSDNTFDIVSSMKDPRIGCLRLSRRSGSYTALKTGIIEAKGDVVLCMSADGQDDPACLKNMLEKLRNGANIVRALRYNRYNEKWQKI